MNHRDQPHPRDRCERALRRVGPIRDLLPSVPQPRQEHKHQGHLVVRDPVTKLAGDHASRVVYRRCPSSTWRGEWRSAPTWNVCSTVRCGLAESKPDQRAGLIGSTLGAPPRLTTTFREEVLSQVCPPFQGTAESGGVHPRLVGPSFCPPSSWAG